MTLEQFKKEKINAFKLGDKDAVAAYNVIITKIMNLTIEARSKGQTVSEAEIDVLLKKAEKELIEEKEGFEKAGRLDNVKSLENQIKVVSSYLPKLMSEEQIKEIILGLGGSATNDFGCGAAAALGVKFFKESGEEFIPVGGTLCDVAKIDNSQLTSLLKDVKITLMCDVKNPTYGENGAAYVYAPQKGATKTDVEILDAGLRHICEIVQRDLEVDVASLQGGGAAGAMAAGMVAFLNAELKMGIDTVLSVVDFDEIVAAVGIKKVVRNTELKQKRKDDYEDTLAAKKRDPIYKNRVNRLFK